MDSPHIFESYERSRWALSDIPWSAIDPTRATQAHISAARSALMGECNSIAAVHGFLNEFDDYDFAAFVKIWGYEELQHHFAFRRWLSGVGASIDDRAVSHTLAPYPPGLTRSATLATNVISELTVNTVYAHAAKQVEEPVLADLLLRISRDEARHAKSFGHFLKARLALAPEERQSVLETLFVYTSDPTSAIKHPVSMFKADLEEITEHETIADGLAAFAAADPGNVALLHNKIFTMFSHLLDMDLPDGRAVRRHLRQMIVASAKPATDVALS